MNPTIAVCISLIGCMAHIPEAYAQAVDQPPQPVTVCLMPLPNALGLAPPSQIAAKPNGANSAEEAAPKSPNYVDAPGALRHGNLAKAAGNSASQTTMEVNRPFPQCAAVVANVDSKAPKLSDSGIAATSSGDAQLGSAECLIEGTVNGKFTDCNRGKVVKPEIVLNYVIFNFVTWYAEGGKATSHSDWYLYDRRQTRDPAFPLHRLSPHVSDDLRILGDNDIGFISIHFGIDDSCQVKYTMAAKKRIPANLQNLRDFVTEAIQLYQGNLGSAAKTTKSAYAAVITAPPQIPDNEPAVGIYGFAAVRGIEKLPYDLSLTGGPAGSSPRLIDLTEKRNPTNVLVGVPSPSGFSERKRLAFTWDSSDVPVTCKEKGTAKTTADSSKFIGTPTASGRSDIGRLVDATFTWQTSDASRGQTGTEPSAGPDSSVNTKGQTADDPGTGEKATQEPGTQLKNNDQAATNSLSQTYTNEGLHHWDVSFGFPVKSIKDVTYNSDDGTVRNKTIDRTNVYGFFDFYPVPVDLVKPRSFVAPSISAGIPIANRPFNKPTVGMSIGFNIFGIHVAPFAGVLILKDFRPATLTMGTKASNAQLNSDLTSKRVFKLLVALNFSVSDAVKLLKNTSGQGTSATPQSSNPQTNSATAIKGNGKQ